jgi:hypothetical protein
MALNPKMLKKFLDNPAQFSAQDMGLDESGEQLAPNESEGDGALSIPDVDPEAALMDEAPQIADPDEVNQEVDLENDEEDQGDEMASLAPEMDSDITAKLKKLKSGDTSEVEDEEISADMQAPRDMRKKALEKIKAKYLGQ